MGLDILALEHVQPVEVEDQEAARKQGLLRLFVYEGMESSARGYELNESDGHGARLGPWVESSGETLTFSAGSYTLYNEFREALSRAALEVEPSAVWREPSQWADSPFFELINFSDALGAIGSEAAADLAVDFAEQRDKVFASWADRYGRAALDSLREKYDEWQRAFQLTSGDGAVVFC